MAADVSVFVYFVFVLTFLISDKSTVPVLRKKPKMKL